MKKAAFEKKFWRKKRRNFPIALLQPGLPDGIFFRPIIPIWVHFGGSCNRLCWDILCPFGPFYRYFEYDVAIRYIL
jgi:hypothetical protein